MPLEESDLRSNAGVEMPRYRCHKEVWALKIKAIRPIKFPPCSHPIGLTTCGYGPHECLHIGSRYPVPPAGQHEYTPGVPPPCEIRFFALIKPEDEGYAAFPVTEEYVHKHNPQPGGYFVVYKDGYQSFSPAQAFEEGYTRI